MGQKSLLSLPVATPWTSREPSYGLVHHPRAERSDTVGSQRDAEHSVGGLPTQLPRPVQPIVEDTGPRGLLPVGSERSEDLRDRREVADEACGYREDTRSRRFVAELRVQHDELAGRTFEVEVQVVEEYSRGLAPVLIRR